MRMQDDSPERREMSQALFLVLAGVNDLADIRSQCLAGGLDIRRIVLADGADRFIITERRNGQVWDSFTFYGQESFH